MSGSWLAAGDWTPNICSITGTRAAASSRSCRSISARRLAGRREGQSNDGSLWQVGCGGNLNLAAGLMSVSVAGGFRVVMAVLVDDALLRSTTLRLTLAVWAMARLMERTQTATKRRNFLMYVLRAEDRSTEGR